MAKDTFKKLIKEAREHSEPIVTDALIIGATQLSDKMNHVVRDVNQPPRVLLEKMATTLRNSAITAGKEMMTKGVESIQKDRS